MKNAIQSRLRKLHKSRVGFYAAPYPRARRAGRKGITAHYFDPKIPEGAGYHAIELSDVQRPDVFLRDVLPELLRSSVESYGKRGGTGVPLHKKQGPGSGPTTYPALVILDLKKVEDLIPWYEYTRHPQGLGETDHTADFRARLGGGVFRHAPPEAVVGIVRMYPEDLENALKALGNKMVRERDLERIKARLRKNFGNIGWIVREEQLVVEELGKILLRRANKLLKRNGII